MQILTMLSSLVTPTTASGRKIRRHRKQPRPCLKCGRLHTHNNCFCNADHCHEHRAEQKARRLNHGL
ncbi:hypothetical protein [Endozoicomonas sp. ALE010]|uniref:hypothetical protein n=1 Tax=Endozoicomonas sp. ALE010 TaxID=3403081 RepID=UPI003BB66A99